MIILICKCCFAHVYFCIIDKMTLNISSYFTLMAMYRPFSMLISEITEHNIGA